MEKEILYVGLDVDSQMYHGAIVSKASNEVIEFKCKPIIDALMKQLKFFIDKGYEIKICYEAGYFGYGLCRDLRSRKIHCDIIAPTLIPEVKGPRVKTDRLDSKKLAKLYMNGMLTLIHVPTEEDERDRDLIRARNFLMNKTKGFKQHIIALCRRHQIPYKETKSMTWTKSHIELLQSQINKHENPTLRVNFSLLLYSLEQLLFTIENYDREIEKLSTSPKYKKKVDALLVYRGVKTNTAMTLVTELGDIKRFNHPNQITSYVGMDIMEQSSGGKERKYCLTKMGNRYIRRVIIEACQPSVNTPRLSWALRKRREGGDPEMIAIADRCMKRLYKKGRRLIHRGKHINKIKAACAREMLGFVWESLKKAA